MTRQHRNPLSLIPRLRLSPYRFAAAAALYDPRPLLELERARRAAP